MKKYIETYIPNWQRFCDIYHPDKVFLRAFEERMALVKDDEIQKSLAQKVNVDLGILLLADKEVDESVFEDILKSIKNSGVR